MTVKKEESIATAAPTAENVVAALASVLATQTAGNVTVHTNITPEPGPEGFDTPPGGWVECEATVNACPVYREIVSKDGKHYYHPRFRPGEKVLVPRGEQTDKYVQVGQLKPPGTFVPSGQMPRPWS